MSHNFTSQIEQHNILRVGHLRRASRAGVVNRDSKVENPAQIQVKSYSWPSGKIGLH